MFNALGEMGPVKALTIPSRNLLTQKNPGREETGAASSVGTSFETCAPKLYWRETLILGAKLALETSLPWTQFIVQTPGPAWFHPDEFQ